MSNIVVKINSIKFTGWKTLVVQQSMDNLAGVFEVIASGEADFNSIKSSVKMGDKYEVLINDIPLSTGYIEDIEQNYNSAEHNLTIAGRDKVADLVDCGWPEDDVSWEGKTVREILDSILKPFNLSTVIADDVASQVSKRMEWFMINPGDTIFDALKRIASMNSLQIMSIGDGKSQITRAGATNAVDRLELGVNILKGSAHYSDKERFSDYFSKGYGYGTDRKQTKDFVHPKGQAVDPVIKRYRPYTILAEDAFDSFNAVNRAEWEAALRAGNSRTYGYEVQGWLQSDGTPWRINSLVQIKDTTFNLDTTLLIYALTFGFDERGTVTEISLCSPEKYKIKAKVNKIKSEFDG